MSRLKVTIEGELIDLNKYINSQRTNRFAGAKVKKEQTEKCTTVFYPHREKELNLPIKLHITWYCKNKRKDKDNIAFAKKFILDGMIKSGVLENDGWKEVAGFVDNFEIDKDNPRVEIEIEEKV